VTLFVSLRHSKKHALLAKDMTAPLFALLKIVLQQIKNVYLVIKPMLPLVADEVDI
jgi:hypothetical protein